ncbi:MAG TPA: hypothetical protein VM510_15120, partial [Caulifigura sp.]|nr:hypothetical protein [Caulifigura sp.]
MLHSKTSSPFRHRPRRHDVGAPVMRQFRQNGVAVGSDAHKGARRVVDALHALMLTVICFTAAIVMDDRTGYRLSEFLNGRNGSSVDAEAQAVASNRVAPPAPELTSPDVESTGVRLSSIEDEPEPLEHFP